MRQRTAPVGAEEMIERARHDMGEGQLDADIYSDAGHGSWSVIASGSTAVPRVAMEPRLYEKPTGSRAALVLGLRAARDALYGLSRTHRLDTVDTHVRLLGCRTDDPTLGSNKNRASAPEPILMPASHRASARRTG
jgi:hypothetical protein